MLVLRADEMGMCFGVRDALGALGQLAAPAEVTIHGELVHNPEVLGLLERRGFHRTGEAGRALPATPVVAITAHGISERERARLLAAGKQLIDTTCPLVTRAHEAAQRLAAAGARVIVLGRADHVEVRGIVEDLDEAIVVAGPDDVATWPQRLLGVVCQTTTEAKTARELLAAIRAANPHAEVRFVDTICAPTKARIDALQALLPRVDALVVVGGHDSNNTRQLARRGEEHGVRTLHVASARELVPGWFDGVAAVGLTAGTSTLSRTIEEVHGWLVRLAASRCGRSA